jgi:hypothetical protein
MQVVTQLWRHNNFGNQTRLDVLLTSESKTILEEQQSFLKNTTLRESTAPFPFRIMTNEADANPIEAAWYRPTSSPSSNNTMDQNMIEALSSIQVQLLAKYTIGNCCSNFHHLLFDFLNAGCGKVPVLTHGGGGGGAECLQANENPEFQLCCNIKTQTRCVRERLLRLAIYQEEQHHPPSRTAQVVNASRWNVTKTEDLPS